MKRIVKIPRLNKIQGVYEGQAAIAELILLQLVKVWIVDEIFNERQVIIYFIIRQKNWKREFGAMAYLTCDWDLTS